MWKKPATQIQQHIAYSILIIVILIGYIFMMCFPRLLSLIVLTGRSCLCITMSYAIYRWLSDSKQCTEMDKLQHFKTIFSLETTILNFYIFMSMFITPFCDKYFLTFVSSTIYFAVELSIIGNFHETEWSSLVRVPLWTSMLFLQTYITRRALTQVFLNQCETEKTRDALMQVLDNLPDAVLMLEADRLEYCNQQADSFFGVSLSQLTTKEEGKSKLFTSQYQILDNRCMHELCTSGTELVAAKMLRDDSSQQSIN